MMGVQLYSGGRLVMQNASLKSLIVTAFGISFWQISGGEPWVDKETYDLEAKPSPGLQPAITNLDHGWTEIADPRLRQMLQELVIDRFQLKFHRETKTGTVFLLQTTNKTLALKPTGSEGSGQVVGNLGYAGGQWNIYNSTLAQIARWASDNVLHAPVIDQTGIRGAYDYRQKVPDLDSDANYSDPTDSFLRFITETGLKLERSKGPVEIFVIDHVERPSPN